MVYAAIKHLRRGGAALAIASAGCAAILGGDDGILAPDAGRDASVAPDGFAGDGAAFDALSPPPAPPPPPPPPVDAGDGGARDSAVDAISPCLADPGSARVGAYCIDRTEITNAKYQAFLTAKAGDAGGQPAVCAWNASYTPSTWPPGAALEHVPVVFVDWCDAYAYCAWAGKRLCGAPGGGPAAFLGYADASASEWFAACSHAGDGQHAYPYGNAYAPAACNGIDANDAGTLEDAASFPGCAGGFPGVYDMSGNAREWEDACDLGDGAAPEADLCRTRGGAAVDGVGALACAAPSALRRSGNSGHTGFRCCTR